MRPQLTLPRRIKPFDTCLTAITLIHLLLLDISFPLSRRSSCEALIASATASVAAYDNVVHSAVVLRGYIPRSPARWRLLAEFSSPVAAITKQPPSTQAASGDHLTSEVIAGSGVAQQGCGDVRDYTGGSRSSSGKSVARSGGSRRRRYHHHQYHQHNRRHGRQLQQLYLGPRVLDFSSITLYAGAPSGEVSVSMARDGKFRLTRDGTVNVGGGFSTAQAVALNPSQGRWRAALTGEGGQGRPSAATAAWVAVPKFFQCCSWFPSRAYFLGEADTGPSGAAAAGGYYFVTEIGANALSGSLGASTSQSHAASVNLPSAKPAKSRAIVSRGDEPLGFAGVEGLGQTNALVNFADPRVEQYGQAIGYPFNIFTPWDPVTCTQVLVTGLATTGINLLPAGTNRSSSTGSRSGGAETAGHAVALPSQRFREAARNGTRTPTGLAPFCLQWFNLQTLDDYRAFIERAGPAYRSDYMDNGYGYSDYYDMTNADDGDDDSNGGSKDVDPHTAPSSSHQSRSRPGYLASGAGKPSMPYRPLDDSFKAAEDWRPTTGLEGRQGHEGVTAVALMRNSSGGVGGGFGATGSSIAGMTTSALPTASHILQQPPQPPQQRPSGVNFEGSVSSQQQAAPLRSKFSSSSSGSASEPSQITPRGTGQDDLDHVTTARPFFVGEERPVGNADSGIDDDETAAATAALGALPPRLQQLLGFSSGSIRSGLEGQGMVPQVLQVGGRMAAAVRAFSDPNVVNGTRRIANTSAYHAVRATQLLSQAAALRTESILRVLVQLVNAGSPLTAFMMNASQAWYDGAARLSNAAVDVAIRRLEEGLPPGVTSELRQRADDMTAQVSAALRAAEAQTKPAGRASDGSIKGL